MALLFRPAHAAPRPAAARPSDAEVRATDRRPPPLLVPALGFAAYFTAVAGLTVLPAGHLASALVLVAVAGAVGWWTSAGVAAASGAFGWFFWSGFVVHAHGRLAFTGPSDAVVLAALVGAAVLGAFLGARRP